MTKNNFNNEEDKELLIKSKEGDEEARVDLLRKYKSMVCAISRPFYLKGGDDEDLIQEGLIAVNTAINNYKIDSKASFSTYAYRCVHNRIIDLIRKNVSAQVLADLEEYSENEPTIEDDIILKQLINDITNTVEENGTKTDKVILEMFLDGESYKEIADNIGKDSKFVDNKLQKIKKLILKRSKEWK